MRSTNFEVQKQHVYIRSLGKARMKQGKPLMENYVTFESVQHVKSQNKFG